ncbi:MAG: cyclic nucleotide-binding domain-containing protein [Gammaproteobacteria bacterium]|nr:cyclic nucleotide-binding domain-containing protein [Gammaproteobacteria bacterium]
MKNAKMNTDTDLTENNSEQKSQFVEWKDNKLLYGLTPEMISGLEPIVKKRKYLSGAEIIQEGSIADEIFLIASGTIGIFKSNKDYKIAELAAGDSVGTIAAIGEQKARTAYAIALTDVDIYYFSIQDINTLPEKMRHSLLSKISINYANSIEKTLLRTNKEVADNLKKRNMLTTMLVIMMSIVFCLSFAASYISSVNAHTNTNYISALEIILLLSVSIYFIKHHHIPPRDFGLHSKSWRWAIKDSLLWTATVCLILLAIKFIIIKTIPTLHNEPLINIWRERGGSIRLTVILSILYMLLVPVQELIARGILQGTLKKILYGKHSAAGAIVIANIMFAFAHQSVGKYYTIMALIGGFFWGWLYNRQNSLIGVSISHIIIGLWVFVALNFQSLAIF